LALTAAICAVALAGCDEYVHITRDRDVHISRHATWAWRPLQEQSRELGRDRKPVRSRDVIDRRQMDTRENDAENDLLRGKVKTAIQQNLMAKGLKEVSEPDSADFLVDFHLAVRRRNVTVERVYPGGGLVCGPYGCYEGWGWGLPGVSYSNVRFREGTIVFDLVQGSTNHLAYRAVGEKPVRRDTFSFSQNEVNDLVGKLLKDLKPAK
jgi:hypothetical protein